MRVALTTAAVIVPALALLTWSHRAERERSLLEGMRMFASARIQGERSACERAAAWPGERAAVRSPRQQFQLYAYDAQLRSLASGAPALELDAARALAPGERRSLDADGHWPPELLMRTPWGSGPCAFVLARSVGTADSQPFAAPMRIYLPVVLVAVLAVVLATGPIVQRLRRLTREVKTVIRGDYQPALPAGSADEIGELTNAFTEASREVRARVARQAERERTLRSFLENTTHDVMIPLTVLQGHLAQLQRRAANAEALDAASFVPAMNEAHYMGSLVHNLAMAAKLDAGEPLLQREPVNLNELVERTISRHAPSARQHEVRLDRAVPATALWTCGDVTLLEQAVGNVVYNAIRYNRPGGHVAMLLEASGDASFLLRVSDDGPGIPEAERSTLVERYTRGNAARSREPAGQGLGLNIAFRVAAVHAWELRLSSSELAGLQVDFSGATCAAPDDFRVT